MCNLFHCSLALCRYYWIVLFICFSFVTMLLKFKQFLLFLVVDLLLLLLVVRFQCLINTRNHQWNIRSQPMRPFQLHRMYKIYRNANVKCSFFLVAVCCSCLFIVFCHSVFLLGFAVPHISFKRSKSMGRFRFVQFIFISFEYKSNIEHDTVRTIFFSGNINKQSNPETLNVQCAIQQQQHTQNMMWIPVVCLTIVHILNFYFFASARCSVCFGNWNRIKIMKTYENIRETMNANGLIIISSNRFFEYHIFLRSFVLIFKK